MRFEKQNAEPHISVVLLHLPSFSLRKHSMIPVSDNPRRNSEWEKGKTPSNDEKLNNGPHTKCPALAGKK